MLNSRVVFNQEVKKQAYLLNTNKNHWWNWPETHKDFSVK